MELRRVFPPSFYSKFYCTLISFYPLLYKLDTLIIVGAAGMSSSESPWLLLNSSLTSIDNFVLTLRVAGASLTSQRRITGFQAHRAVRRRAR